MAKVSEIEEKLLDHLPDDRLYSSLALIRQAAEDIWADDAPRIIKDYTDHGITHSERLAGFAAKLLEANDSRPPSAEEMYLLLAGIYLHDIGMQCDVVKFPEIKARAEALGARFDVEFTAQTASDYSIDEQKSIRNNHQYLTAAWIDHAYCTGETMLGRATKSVPEDLVDDLMDVCKHHARVPITDCPLTFRFDPTGRKQLVAALLRFADELDVDGHRVSIETVKNFRLDPRNSVYWWLHNRTKIIFSSRNVIILTIRLHPDDVKWYGSFVHAAFITEFQSKNRPVLSVLAQNGIPIVISADSKVVEHDRAEPLSPEIVQALRAMQQKRDSPGVRHVLVIGGAGYIGSVLVRKLLDRGYNITVLDALLYGDESIRDLYNHPGFALIRNDLRNIEAVCRALQYADDVVHLGALVGDPACALSEKLTLEINLAATRMIAEAARGFGIQRFIFASTCSVYGASDQILDEHSPLSPHSLYSRTKIGSERVLLALSDDRFAPIILRFGTVYGISPRPRFDLVINLLAAKATCEKSITIFGGYQWRPFVHVDDVAGAILKCLEAPLQAVQGQIFNVGSEDQNYQIAQLGDLVKELIPNVEVVCKGEDTDRRNYRVSFGKMQKHLGFTPRRTVAEGILEIKAAIESGRIPDYHDARYSNYKTLSDEDRIHLIRYTRMTLLYAGGWEE